MITWISTTKRLNQIKILRGTVASKNWIQENDHAHFTLVVHLKRSGFKLAPKIPSNLMERNESETYQSAHVKIRVDDRKVLKKKKIDLSTQSLSLINFSKQTITRKYFDEIFPNFSKFFNFIFNCFDSNSFLQFPLGMHHQNAITSASKTIRKSLSEHRPSGCMVYNRWRTNSGA